jgi:hypothetical protein
MVKFPACAQLKKGRNDSTCSGSGNDGSTVNNFVGARLGCGYLGDNLRNQGEEFHCLRSLHEQGTAQFRS